jgi:hypothetical protein
MIALTTSRAAALKVVAVYWALLLFGIVLYSTVRLDALSTLAPIWAGAVGGTILGQILAARRYRPWLAVLIIIAVALFLLPHAPPQLGGKRLWAAYLPAAVCGYWSLGDRTSLAAFWFPAVIWMLSILDGTGASSLPGRNGMLLFAALAALFVVYLRVREERRIALWRTTSPEPLAKTRAPIIVKEPAGVQVARGAWGVLVSGLGFAAAAWLAPSLWQHESHEGTHVTVAGSHHQLGLPCCPAVEEDEPVHTRVKEYLDIGRANTKHELHRPGTDCRVCTGEVTVAEAEPYVGGGGPGGAWTPEPGYVPPQTTVQTGGGWSAPVGDPAPSGEYVQRSDDTPPGAPPQVPQAPSVPAQPTYNPYAPGTPEPSPTIVGPSGMSETNTPGVANPPPPVQAPQAPPVVEPTPQAAPPPPPPEWHSSNQPRSTDVPAPTDHMDVSVRPDGDAGPQLLHWIAVLVLSMFLMKIIALALRPLRRMVVLRHLRRPFWAETVDQRVSNAWQLVLVGLRDAGWRPSSTESPRELAKRVAIDGVETCATILDRTRHGIRIDRGDLDEMVASASTAYRGSRKRLGVGARLFSWLRWPLV